MFSIKRRLTAMGAFAAVLMGLAACGGGASGEVVAKVAGVGSVSKATLEHWMPVEAVVLHEEVPKKPAPRGVMPVPPNYTACIAYLQSTPQKLTESGGKPTILQAKLKCEQRYQQLKILTLNTLVGWYWILGAGVVLGMKPNDAEARQRLKQVNSGLFPKPGEFDNYLKLTGQTTADMLFRSRVQLVEVKIGEKLTAIANGLPKSLTPEQRNAALSQFTNKLPPGKPWVDKTTCRSGYVVSACKEYRGPEAPGVPN